MWKVFEVIGKLIILTWSFQNVYMYQNALYPLVYAITICQLQMK
jgi:hypothetical protein